MNALELVNPGANVKGKKGVKVMKKFAIGFMALVLVFAFVGMGLCTDPWNDAEMRQLNKDLMAWATPEKVGLTGTTCFVIDVTKSRVHILDTAACTAGASIFMDGTATIPTMNYIVIYGNGKHITPASNTSGHSVINYYDSGAWPFPNTTYNRRVYVLQVLSGIGNYSGVSGNTVYVLSGTTIY